MKIICRPFNFNAPRPPLWTITTQLPVNVASSCAIEPFLSYPPSGYSRYDLRENSLKSLDRLTKAFVFTPIWLQPNKESRLSAIDILGRSLSTPPISNRNILFSGSCCAKRRDSLAVHVWSRGEYSIQLSYWNEKWQVFYYWLYFVFQPSKIRNILNYGQQGGRWVRMNKRRLEQSCAYNLPESEKRKEFLWQFQSFITTNVLLLIFQNHPNGDEGAVVDGGVTTTRGMVDMDQAGW